MSTSHSKTSFQDDWLTGRNWLRKAHDPRKAYCLLCTTTFDIENGGKAAVTSHAKGKTHTDLVNAKKKNVIGAFFTSAASSSKTSSSVTSEPTSATPISTHEAQNQQPTKQSPFVVTNDVVEAEITWCLHTVEEHLSYRHCDSMQALFKRMFKGNPVAENFKMKKDKCRYLIVHGLYPALKEQLVGKIAASPFYSVSFDESLNRDKQECQMDVTVRYWDKGKHIAQSVYFDSQFLLRPNSDNLTEAIFAGIKELDRAKFLQLAMDGPNTNWVVLDLLNEQQLSSGFIATVDIGSCSLHILHGAFQTGMTATGWLMEKLLRALYKIFDESPARRDVYLRVGSSDVFPYKFCATRWIEDDIVADRAQVVWPSIVSTIKYWMSLCQSKRPRNNKSFDTLVENHLDVFVPARFEFFSFIARILKPYLVIFQSDHPLVPFMFDELSVILYRLLRLTFKKKKVDNCKSLSQMMNEKFLTNSENQLEEYLVDIGAAATELLGNLEVANEKKRKFRQDARNGIVQLLLKLAERLPTNKLIIVAASSLSPVNMAKIPEKASKRFKKLAANLYSLKYISKDVADNAKFQYDAFLKEEVVLKQEMFLKFNYKSKTQRVDSFFYPLVAIHEEYSDLWKIMQIIFIMTHGQSYTERGFSINKLTSDVNMEDDSLVAQRFLYDSIKNAGATAADFPITKQMKSHCSKARQRYETARAVNSKKAEAAASELKRKSEQDLKSVKKQKLDLEASISTLKNSLYEEAIASSNRKDGKDHATKAAAFAVSLKDKEEKYKELVKVEEGLEKEYRALLK